MKGQAAVDALVEGGQFRGFQLAQLAEALDGGAVPDGWMHAMGVGGLGIVHTHRGEKPDTIIQTVTDLRCRSSHSSAVTPNVTLEYRLMRVAIWIEGRGEVRGGPVSNPGIQRPYLGFQPRRGVVERPVHIQDQHVGRRRRDGHMWSRGRWPGSRSSSRTAATAARRHKRQ